MLAEKYEITKRITDGVNIVGYELKALSTGNITTMNKDYVYNLALNNQILGCKVQKYKGEVRLKGVDVSIRSLPKVNISNKNKGKVKNVKEYTVIARILDRNSIFGYVISKNNGERRVYKKQDAIKLIKSGVVKNARVQKSNGKYIIRGVDCNLDQLEIINKNKLRG